MAQEFNDRQTVNFDEDYELNYHLKKWQYRQSQANRATLRRFENTIKSLSNNDFVTHQEMDSYIEQFGANELESLSSSAAFLSKEKARPKNSGKTSWWGLLIFWLLVILFFYFLYHGMMD